VFQNLKKVRQYSYSLDRALDLSDSIARDFDSQLKKIIIPM
jgi:hypothetical protein